MVVKEKKRNLAFYVVPRVLREELLYWVIGIKDWFTSLSCQEGRQILINTRGREIIDIFASSIRGNAVTLLINMLAAKYLM